MMPDREKVIKWLDVCKTADRAVGLKEDYPCRECPYKGSPRCMRELVADALALLKEQDNEIYALHVELASANELAEGYVELLKGQEDKIRQLRLALQIMNGNGIRVDTEGR